MASDDVKKILPYAQSRAREEHSDTWILLRTLVQNPTSQISTFPNVPCRT